VLGRFIPTAEPHLGGASNVQGRGGRWCNVGRAQRCRKAAHSKKAAIKGGGGGVVVVMAPHPWGEIMQRGLRHPMNGRRPASTPGRWPYAQISLAAGGGGRA
jgi:hypothetical protein